jgi:electron transport complex protein RnfB
MNDDTIYRRLQQHLDEQPVGFPKTKSGVEIKILKDIFTPEQAEIALFLNYKYQTVEEISKNINNTSTSLHDLEMKLDEMGKHGIFRSDMGEKKTYALIPFVTGIYEMQINRISKEFANNTIEFYKEGFGIEYLSTEIPQMRVIPIETSITPENRISTYDELKSLIFNADHIALAECACKKSRDYLERPCERTKRREVCMYFRNFGETFLREGWGRQISKDEALEIARLSEKEGLVIQSSNEQNPQFICACCSCCCGVLGTLKLFPKPADFIASNFYVSIDSSKCKGCGTCIKRCHMEAISISKNIATVDIDRCIGCGLCVSGCPNKTISLKNKSKEIIPPKNTEEMYDIIGANKKSKWEKIKMILKQNPIQVLKNVKNAE